MTPARLTTLGTAARTRGRGPVPSHRLIWTKAVAGEIPAFQVNGIWHFDPALTDEICDKLGVAAARAEMEAA